MKSQKLFALAIGFFAVTAANVLKAVEFPHAGGELSVPGDWGENAPGVSDGITISQNGDYTISSDLEVNAIAITAADAPSISASDGVKITLNAAYRAYAIQGSVNKMNGLQLTGGFYYTPNVATVFPIYGPNLNLVRPGSTAFLSGVSISNLYIFGAANRSSEARTTLMNGCRVWTTTLHVGSGANAVSNTLEVTGGSQIFSKQHFYPDGSADCLGRNSLRVSGEGTLVSIGDSTYSGGNAGTNSILVTDCATFAEAKSMMLGRTYGGDSVTFANCATGMMSNVEIGYAAKDNRAGDGNSFSVLSGSYVTVNRMVVGEYSSGNVLVVDSATLCPTGGLVTGKNGIAAATDNTVILRGTNAQIRIPSGQWIYAYNRSTFRFEVPATGYADTPIKSSHCQWSGDVTFEVECKAFRKAGGGDIVLVEAGASTWIDQNTDGNLAARLAALNASQPQGCYFSIVGKQVIYHASYLPPLGMRMMIR